MVLVVSPHIRGDVEGPQTPGERTQISWREKNGRPQHASKRKKKSPKGRGRAGGKVKVVLTAFSSVGVAMDGKAARAVKPFPAAATDMFPCLGVAVTVIRVHRASRHGVSAGVHFVENELRGDETGTDCRVVAPGFDEILGRGQRGYLTGGGGSLLGKSSRRLGRGVGDMKEGWPSRRPLSRE